MTSPFLSPMEGGRAGYEVMRVGELALAPNPQQQQHLEGQAQHLSQVAQYS